MNVFRIAGLVAVVCSLLLLGVERVTPADQQLWEYRNLGKAFYENPDTHVQAVEELKKALDLKPDSVRERINYGLALLRAGQTDKGVAELLQAQKQDPSLPHTWFNLGIVYKNNADYDKAIEQFRGMIKLAPNEPAGHYNLAAVLRSRGDTDAALPEFLEAERLNPNLAGPHFQLFTLYQRMGKKDDAARERKLFEEAKKRDEGAAVPENMEWCFYAELYDPRDPRPTALATNTRYDDHPLSQGWDPAHSGLVLIDADSSEHADLLAWSADRIALYRHGAIEQKQTGLEGIKGVLDVAAGDFDNDGFPDLCVLTADAAILFHNDHGQFRKFAELPGTAGATRAIWFDYDHDNDLDLLLFGPHPVLMRNDGENKFEDKGPAFPFVKGDALSAAPFAVRGDTAARDLVVSYADRPAVLYRDKLNGMFEATDLPQIPAGSAMLAAEDVNHDGLLDLVAYAPQPLTIINAAKDVNAPAVFKVLDKAQLPPSPLRADFNGDTREDYARILPDGSLHVYTNASADQHWSTVSIRGQKNIKLANNSTIEMKSGAYYGKRISQGVPIAFPVDDRADIDTIRITWPNGLIQNEPRQKRGELLKIPEAQRLSGSCPMIFTWNGEKFQFITDVLGVAPLGASSGDGHYFPVDHDEYIQIPGSALKLRNGKYQVHITEELHEVSYLDQVKLIAVDHPAAQSIYTNDKFKSPPYPEFRLFGAEKKIHPLRATDAHGVDATARVQALDHRYPDAFRHNSAGVAELHTLDLGFGSAARDNKAALVLNGWVDWADGSTFLGAAQSGHGLIFPYLQVKDAAGQWKTVVADMGIPSGKPKTIVVDLAGKFLSPSREVRIVTNLCVYWDEVFLIENSAAPQVRMAQLDASQAQLHFRGFSRPVIDPARQQPEQFLYDQVRPVSSWNPTRGRYTRYGDVLPLVKNIDDEMVIMGSGDELMLEYSASDLPALAPGWTRDFLLLVDGWAKDSDANTAFSESVLPLPFHAMSAYPYPKAEAYPNDPEHQRYLREYLTRPALELIRPLAHTGY
ncbi:MAG TPA: FG-GAP-like repeat-containing protein [Bryobacteraceae bacterium]|jgi:tetratricopeptide (TPR) repeat protein|nr:FG-GAP-like repeat-containing protein [Bryobacteraceae bacterium]